MSLLPMEILPEMVSLGTVNKDGTVTINHNWWLFLYNVYLNSIAPSGTTPAPDIFQVDSFSSRSPIIPPNPDASGDTLQMEAWLPRVPSIPPNPNPSGDFLSIQSFLHTIIPPLNVSESQGILANQIFGS